MSTRKQHILIILLMLALCVPAYFTFAWHRTLYEPMLVRQGVTSIKVYPGNTIHDLAKILYAKRLITHPHIFIFAARLSGHSKKLRFGEYRIWPGMSAYTLLNNIISGRDLVKYQITFVEGRTFQDMLNVLEEDPNLFHRLKGKSTEEIMQLLGHPGEHPEGLFMPETYTFIWGNTDIEILSHAYERMQKYLTKQWEQRASGLPYRSAYQALIIASLIEKETSVDSERPIIASVILHRLKKRMRLQVDPTVLYGLNKPYNTPITRDDLKSKTSYNTYRIYGLPPTPIDMPSKASIYAALHPANTPYLYYVATGDGSHIFSKTYAEHLRAVKKYRAWQKQQLEESNAGI